MTTPGQLADDREAFRQHARASSEQAERGDEEAADTHTEAGNAIVDRWVRYGRARDLLLPLLDDAVDEVRYAAAARLLTCGAVDRAVPVLEDIARAERDVFAPLARYLLRRWRARTGAWA